MHITVHVRMDTCHLNCLTFLLLKVINGDQDAVIKKKMAILPAYNSAMQLFITGKFEEAMGLFKVILLVCVFMCICEPQTCVQLSR